MLDMQDTSGSVSNVMREPGIAMQWCFSKLTAYSIV